jgi:adenine phosphoribosyltransferase
MNARDRVLQRFRWIDGDADILGLFGDAPTLAAVVSALAEPFQADNITKVAAIEARGFVLGGAVATALNAGFVAIRKPGSLLPGDMFTHTSEPDYRGNTPTFFMQRHALGPDDRVLLVDDWAERGSQAQAAHSLIAAAGATYAGLSIIVDQLEPELRTALAPVVSIVTASELPPLR